MNLSTPPGLNRKTVDAVPMEGDDAGVDLDADLSDAAADDVSVESDAADDTASPADVPAPLPDLAPPQPDATEPDAPLVINGRPCSASDQCQSGFCVDSVCCSISCTGVCQACNVPGSLGTCAPVSAGQDPDNECPQDPVATCGRDGTCNGQGACRRYLEGTECAPGGCTGSDEHAASTCNGAGACIAGKTVSCSPHMCMNGSCATTCAQQTDCLTGFFCDGSACRAQHALGDACSKSYECASGQCVDKVCCNTACTEACHACALPGAVGTCTTTPTGQDPRAECPAEATTSCGRAGACDGMGKCRLYPSGTACGAGASCANDVETAPSACNGLGVCLPGAMRACGTYRCGATSCNTTCTMPSQCKPGYECTAGGVCLLLPTPALYWKFDESSGTTATDASGNRLNGTYIGSSGTPTPSASVPKLVFADPSSRSFVRANRQAVQLANMPASIEPTTNLSISLWYRATTIDTGPPGSTAGSELLSAGDNYLLRLHIGDIEISKNNSSGHHTMCLATVSNHLDGNWHHVVGVITNAAMTVYFDGVQKMSCPDTTGLSYMLGKDLFVGRHGNDTANSGYYDFEGNIDDVRIYGAALTPTQITALAAGN